MTHDSLQDDSSVHWIVTITAMSLDRPSPPKLVLQSTLYNDAETDTTTYRQCLVSDDIPIDPDHPLEGTRHCSIQLHYHHQTNLEQQDDLYLDRLSSVVLSDSLDDDQDQEDDPTDYEEFVTTTMLHHERTTMKQKEQRLNQGRWRHRWRGRRK